MKVSVIICPQCKSTQFKDEAGTYVCETCGYALTDEDRQNILNSLYEQHKAESGVNITAKVYRMNDYEWWASNLTPEETLEHYMLETGIEPEDTYPVEEITECNLDKDGMFIPLEDSEKIAELEKSGLSEQIVKVGHGYGFGTIKKFNCEWFIKVPFRKALEYNKFSVDDKPFCIASTET